MYAPVVCNAVFTYFHMLLWMASVCPHSLQVLCLSEQILFTQRCEEAINAGSLQELLIELEAQLAGV